MARILDFDIFLTVRGVAQPGRVLRSGRRGPRFKSGHPDQITRFRLTRQQQMLRAHRRQMAFAS